jgi:hypothetical protein
MELNVVAEKISVRYEDYVKGSISPEKPLFWIIFWTGCALCCTFQYFYIYKYEEYFGISKSEKLTIIVLVANLLIPVIFLRRLHIVAVVIVFYLLVKII